MLVNFQDCFADKGESLGCNVIEQTIPRESETHTTAALRECELIQKEIDDMLRHGVTADTKPVVIPGK